MNSLRAEQEETQAKYEEAQGKVKVLEQENLAKEQEITSLSHKNQLLEAEVEKHEGTIKEHKDTIANIGSNGTQNESLQRKLQVLEDEAEESDKQLRETNEKYAASLSPDYAFGCLWHRLTMYKLRKGYDKRMSKLGILNARYKLWRARAISGRRSMKRCPRSMQLSRRNWRISSSKSVTSE